MIQGEIKHGMEFWYTQGGFTIVRTPSGRLFQYSQMFYGNWKVYPPYMDGKVTSHKTEEDVINYLINQ